jgi:ssDNA-binding Zn-finger/Zn-ribbon topoisomerase 1
MDFSGPSFTSENMVYGKRKGHYVGSNIPVISTYCQDADFLQNSEYLQNQMKCPPCQLDRVEWKGRLVILPPFR